MVAGDNNHSGIAVCVDSSLSRRKGCHSQSGAGRLRTGIVQQIDYEMSDYRILPDIRARVRPVVGCGASSRIRLMLRLQNSNRAVAREFFMGS